MNIQQKLTDISVLVNYIKDYIDASSPVIGSERLDEIGKTTLEIANILQTMEEKTGKNAQALFNEYKSTISETADTMQKKLLDVKSTIDGNTAKTKELYAKIENIYAEYTGLLEQSMKTLELQRENYANEARNLSAEVKTLADITDSLREKMMTREETSNLVSDLERQVSEIVRQDEELNEAYLENANRLENMIDGIQNSYQGLNEALASVEESFQTAVSRLDMLLMQMNLLTERKEGLG